jgi:acyl-CoA thioesterase II
MGPPSVPDGAGSFLALLALDVVGADTFRARRAPGPAEQLSRGALAAQGLVAAASTVDTDWRWVHSLHVAQLAAGDANRPVEYEIERIRDSEHFSTRLVRATQGGAPLATMTVSFQVPRPSRAPTHQQAELDDWPDPHGLPATEAGAAMDVRYVDRVPWSPTGPPDTANRIWLRFTEEIPDRIMLHAAAIVYAADLLLVEPLVGAEGPELAARHGLHAENLDLSVRFHQGFRADDWMRHEHELPIAVDHRVLTTGRFFSSMGRLVASVSQETALVPAAARDIRDNTTVVVNGPAAGSRKE